MITDPMTRTHSHVKRSLHSWVLLLTHQIDKGVTKNGEEWRESNSYREHDGLMNCLSGIINCSEKTYCLLGER